MGSQRRNSGLVSAAVDPYNRGSRSEMEKKSDVSQYQSDRQ